LNYNIKAQLTFIFLLVLTLITFVNPVKASIELTDEQYYKLSLFFSPGKIARLTDEEIEYYLSIDDDDIATAQKYYKVIETENGTICQEVSEFEAINGANAMMSLPGTVGTLSTFYQTLYKKISIMRVFIGNYSYEIYLYTEWLMTPGTKSFDVTGLRVFDATVSEGSQSGLQTSWNATNGYSYVDYAWNGTNIVKQSEGFGISMNLIDSGTKFYADIEATIHATSQYAKVYGSYQHARANVTLNQSQGYIISQNGYGNVFNFATSVEGYYDGMGGVYITLPYNN
jgi:hypothetical protein